MAKTKSNRNGGGAKQRGNWSNADHDARTQKRIASLNKKRRRQQEASEPSEDNENGNGEDQQQQQQQQQQLQPPLKDEPPKQRPKQPKEPHHELPIHQVLIKKRSHHRNNHQRLASQVPDDAYKRSFLAHDNFDQIDSSKLRLATAQIQRKVDLMKERLEHWDPVAEAELAALQTTDQDKTSIEYKMKLDARYRKEDREARQKAQSEYNLQYAKHGVNTSRNRRKANLKKNPRPGPESWKLRGAARPAWEVYDFDVRFVDVHIKAKEEANEVARRSRNVVGLCRGRFAMDNGIENGDDNAGNNNNNEIENGDEKSNNDKHEKQFTPPQPHCCEYLSLLTQLGSLQLTRKNYSSARKSFLEAIELEGTQWPTSITNARYQLMNMYLSTNRPSSARKLWITLENDGSAWIKYSAALIEYVSWNLLHEEGSTSETAEELLTQAIRGNIYVAYYLGWPQTFRRAMEYTDEVVERGLDSKSGSMLEAIEYGCGWYNEENDAGKEDGENEEKGMGMWLSTEGSLDWVRSVMLKVMTAGGRNDEDGDQALTKADLLSWETKLAKEDEAFEKERNDKEQKLHGGEYTRDLVDDSNDEEEEEPDVVMYGGMFRTAMDWLQDAGEFLKEPSYDYIEEEEDDGGDANANDTMSDKLEKEENNAATNDGSSDNDGSDDDSSEENDEAKELESTKENGDIDESEDESGSSSDGSKE